MTLDRAEKLGVAHAVGRLATQVACAKGERGQRALQIVSNDGENFVLGTGLLVRRVFRQLELLQLLAPGEELEPPSDLRAKHVDLEGLLQRVDLPRVSVESRQLGNLDVVM